MYNHQKINLHTKIEKLKEVNILHFRNISLKRLFAYFLALMLFAALAPCGLALFGSEELKSGTVAAFSKSSDFSEKISFSAEDFTSRVSKGSKLDGIMVTVLPDASAGVLKLSGRDILRGEGIAAESLGGLSFTPNSGVSINTGFSFIPVFKNGVASDEVRIGINVGAGDTTAPIAENLKFETYAGIAVSGLLKASDPEKSEITYKVIDKPAKGDLTLENNSFSYVPYQGKTGTDTFTFTASDRYGNTSDPATVTIVVNKRSSKQTLEYADMDSHSAHYAAIKMSEAGIITGEKIGDSYFLMPDKTVSRGEFTAMCVAAAELSIPAVALSTGLADDKDIPSWAKPYISAALKEGIVSGSADSDGNRRFRANDAITRAEAAVVINNLAKLADENRVPTFTDADNIPAWAAQAAANINSLNLIPAFADGSMRPAEPISRAEAVSILYDTVNVLKKEKKGGGLLFWAKS